jgi:hypothetical protein
MHQVPAKVPADEVPDPADEVHQKRAGSKFCLIFLDASTRFGAPNNSEESHRATIAVNHCHSYK